MLYSLTMEVPEGVTRLDVEQVIATRYAEASNRILDPYASYTGMMHMLLGTTPVYEQIAGMGPGLETFNHNPNVIQVLEDIEALEQRVDPKGEKAPHVRELLVIQELEKGLKVDPATHQLFNLGALGIIAGSNKPAAIPSAMAEAVFDPTKVIKKPARETPEQKVFRTAVLALRRYAFPRFNPQRHARFLRVRQAISGSSGPEALKPLLANPETAADAVWFGNSNNIRGMAHKILERLFDAQTNRRDTLDEIFVYKEKRKLANAAQIQKQREAEAAIARQATIQTGWDILGQTAARELLRLTDDETSEKPDKSPPKHERSEQLPDEIEEDRMARLGRIVMAWGGERGVHWDIAVAKFSDNSKRQKYRLIILRELDPNGNVVLEHAIGDVGIKDNVLIVLRGEVADWSQGAFDEDKLTAVAHGAKKMYHTPTLEERLWDYLTLPADKLSKPPSQTQQEPEP